jgi:hypothetical protein
VHRILHPLINQKLNRTRFDTENVSYFRKRIFFRKEQTRVLCANCQNSCRPDGNSIVNRAVPHEWVDTWVTLHSTPPTKGVENNRRIITAEHSSSSTVAVESSTPEIT